MSCAAAGLGESEVPGSAATLERACEYPLAQAIVSGASDRGVALATMKVFEARTGGGFAGEFWGRRIGIGNRRLLSELGIDSSAFEAIADGMRAEAQMVMFLAIDGLGRVGDADRTDERRSQLAPSTPPLGSY